jgi:hypothetical protein
VTPLHKEWVALARDFTLFTNLHVQVRIQWYNPDGINADTRALYNRTPLADAVTNRIRMLRAAASSALQPVQGAILMQPVLQPGLQVQSLIASPFLSLLGGLNAQDASGNAMNAELALQLIQAALLR